MSLLSRCIACNASAHRRYTLLSPFILADLITPTISVGRLAITSSGTDHSRLTAVAINARSRRVWWLSLTISTDLNADAPVLHISIEYCVNTHTSGVSEGQKRVE